ncbi:MAG: hypothetical protein PVH93_07590 [Nitrosopumilaceae archaeon]|jgi:hypothetical protein
MNKTKLGVSGLVALVAVLAISTVAIAFTQSVSAAPANKTVIGSGLIGAQIASDDWQTIISGTIKTSTPSDLVISHDQECTIHTGLNLDQDNEQATSAIRQDIRLLVDGEVVPATYGDEDGIVTLCGRAYQMDTNVLSTVYDLCNWAESLDLDGDGVADNADICSDDEIYFDSFIRTKQAHGWHWIALDVGSGEHSVEVQSKLINELDGVGNQNGKKGPAKDSGDTTVDTVLEIGKRNLIVTEEKLATGTTQ